MSAERVRLVVLRCGVLFWFALTVAVIAVRSVLPGALGYLVAALVPVFVIARCGWWREAGLVLTPVRSVLPLVLVFAVGPVLAAPTAGDVLAAVAAGMCVELTARGRRAGPSTRRPRAGCVHSARRPA